MTAKSRTRKKSSVMVSMVSAASCLLLFSPPATCADDATPVGVWLHPNKRIQIEIAPCGDLLCAKIVWFKSPNNAAGLPLADVKSSDPTLRQRALLGLTVLRDLRHTGENIWEDGKIYNPDNGENYEANMSIEADSTLRVRAFMLTPLLGETLIWTRVH